MIFIWVLFCRAGFQAFSLRSNGKSNQLVFPDRFVHLLSFIFFSRIDIALEVSSKAKFAVARSSVGTISFLLSFVPAGLVIRVVGHQRPSSCVTRCSVSEQQCFHTIRKTNIAKTGRIAGARARELVAPNIGKRCIGRSPIGAPF